MKAVTAPPGRSEGVNRELIGVAMVLGSATSYGITPILAKLAYAVGLGTQQILAIRFSLAAVGMVAVAVAVGQNPFKVAPARLVKVAGIGIFAYTAQSLTFFLALRTLPASLVALISYTYPTLVVLFGWLFGGQAVRLLHAMALVGSVTGVALLLGGFTFTGGWGLIFAFANPVACTAYMLIGERVMDKALAVQTSATIVCGAALGFGVLAIGTGEARLPETATGWGIIVAMVVVPTMLGVSLMLAALPRIGAARAAVLSTWEPVVTVCLAAVILGDRLAPWQLAGGVLLVATAITLQFGHGKQVPVVEH